jgi:tol-pal system protein YbgF
LEERLRKFEPVKVKFDGVEFLAEPAEIKAYEQALAVFRQGDFVNASLVFSDFLRRYPSSGYAASAWFWLGNAQYANRDYKEAIRNFSALLSKSAEHPRAPESMLSIANCQLELKDIKSARKTLDDLIKNYPQSEAAGAARERLSKLK